MLDVIPEFLKVIEVSKINELVPVITVTFALLYILLERYWPYKPNVKIFRKGMWLDLVWYTVIQSGVLAMIIFPMIIFPLKNFFHLGDTNYLSFLGFGGIILFFLITHDCYAYFFHKWQHNNPILWRLHEAHHSVRQVDYLAGSRSHFLEIIINQTIEFAPIFFLLDTNTALYIAPLKAIIDSIWGMWIHSNINVNTGKLQYIINGPEMHQWHHANHKEVFYKNYSTKFAFWDWIFGTAYLPSLDSKNPKKKPILFGLPYDFPQEYFTQTFFSLYRFDYQSLKKSKYYQSYINMRKNILKKPLSLFMSSEVINNELFDEKNEDYKIDESIKLCSKCKSKQKYFYDSSTLVYYCEKCDNSEENFSKFAAN